MAEEKGVVDYGVLRALQALLQRNVHCMYRVAPAHLLRTMKKAILNANARIRSGRMGAIEKRARLEFATAWHEQWHSSYKKRVLPKGWPASLTAATSMPKQQVTHP